MRICFVSEGCYPYVAGGVSSWIHTMIKAFPKVDFVIWTVIVDRSMSGRFVYNLPDNVVEVHETYLNDKDWGFKARQYSIPRNARRALRTLLLVKRVDWEGIFDFVHKDDPSVNDLLMGTAFYNIIRDFYDRYYPQINFTDFLWTMRSVYLPLFQVLGQDVPKADLYHCVATGYAGILGCLATHINGGGLLISEHGIYTREREEELIKADWLQSFYKNIWIEHFKKMSQAAYDRAWAVTSLFEHARELQAELGCPEDIQLIIPNGIDLERFKDIPRKDEDDEFVNIGAFVRVTPIKDIKTLLQAFSVAKESDPRLRLWVMGPDDEDLEYANECREYTKYLGISDVIFTGRIKTLEYIGKMDFTILTSISEGQPLVILESFAAHLPVIATDVGNCRGLIFGEGKDRLGAAGIVTHLMNVNELSSAMLELAAHPRKTAEMGEIGYRRVKARYTLAHMRRAYNALYRTLAERNESTWPE